MGMYQVRRQRIVQMTRERGAVKIQDLKTALGVSEATLRRDLAILARQGALRRVHGGATAIEGVERALDWYSAHDTDLKVRIGTCAAKLVKPKMTVSLENGGTTFEVARALLRTPDIRVVTNSLYIAYLLNLYGKCKGVELTGGTLRQDSYLFGPFTNLTLSHFTVDIAFIGTMALSVEKGITDPDLMTAETKRTFIHNARQAVLVADHKKMGRVETMTVESLTALHALVTTQEAPLETVEEIRGLGVQVITC